MTLPCTIRSYGWLVIVACCAAAGLAQTGEEACPPALLAADAHTTSLYRFDAATAQKQIPDLSGRSAPAVLSDHVQIIPIVADTVEITHAGRIEPGGVEDARTPGLTGADAGKAVQAGQAFSIDVYARFLSAGGYFCKVGNRRSLAWGVCDRDGTVFLLQYSASDSQGKEQIRRIEARSALLNLGPIRYDRFYLWSLTFDGRQTFGLYGDGVLLQEYHDPELAQLTIDAPTLAVGTAVKWKSSFTGDVAQVRVSNVQRQYVPQRRPQPQNVAAGATQPVGFDMTTAQSPVEEGCFRVGPETTYEAKGGYGWVGPAVLEAHDFWFTSAGARYDPDKALEQGSYRLRRWLVRDGHVVKDGATFRADVPAGLYAVAVTVGHMREDTHIGAIVINGQPMAQNVRARWKYVLAHPEDRTVRAIVKVNGDGLQVRFDAPREAPAGCMSVLGIEVCPYAAPPVVREQGRLVWKGDGSAPAGFAEAAAAYARGDLRDAADRARAIDSPLARAATWAWILGYPASAEAWQFSLVWELLDTLRAYHRQQPQDVAATALLDATERYWHLAARSAGNQRTDLVTGMRHRMNLEATDCGLEITPEEPFYGQAQFQGGTNVYWFQAERHGIPERFEPDPLFGDSRDYFRRAKAQYPAADLPRIYLGEKVPIAKAIAVPAGAPAWAALQHRHVVRSMDVIRYWTDQRQTPDGLLGGGYGDDVEALRWWQIGVLLADDPHVIEGYRKLADKVWSLFPEGYPKHLADVEHNAEPLGDTQPLMALITFGTPRHQEILDRFKTNLPLFRDLWTAKNPQGYRMFRSYFFSSQQVQDRDGDVAYNARATHMLANWAWWTGNSEATQLLHEWAQHWAEAVLREGDGKPAGLPPIVVTFKERRFVWSKDQPWWNPGGMGAFRFPGGHVRFVYHYLLAAYEMSGDERLLEPIRAGLRLLRDHPRPSDPAALTPGSVAYYLYDQTEMRGQTPQVIASAGFALREVAGDKGFDDVLLTHGSEYVKFRVALDRAQTPAERQQAVALLTPMHEEALDTLDYNWALRTSEPKNTDRVRVPYSYDLVHLTTGRLGSGEWGYPFLGVSWKNAGTDVAVLVTINQRESLEAHLYSFAAQPKEIGAMLWRLKPGRYQVTLTPAEGFSDGGAPLMTRRIQVDGRGTRVDLALPPQQQVRLSIRPQ